MLKILAAFLLFTLTIGVFAQNQTDNSARAQSFIAALAAKDFSRAYGFFGGEITSKLPAEGLPPLWASITAQVGEFKRQGRVIKTSLGGGEKITIVCEFEKSSIAVSSVFDDGGKIQGFFFEDAKKIDAGAPKYETPKYADVNLFEEKEITIGAGEWALPATLTMPKSKTNVPAVVLVHGSGANDRDETHVNPANKVFKDLAWGLASKGVAVLRYDKRTLVHGRKLAAKKDFTVNEETVDDALLAVELLRKTPNVNAKNIFVLGHSLGGYVIPRIGERDARIAGFVNFAGATRPLEDMILEQNAYFATLDGAVSPAEQKQLDELKKTVAKIKSLKETDKNSGEFYFGAYPAYYIDLQNYNPPKAAARLKQPMLVLQGESDYQVTMTDFANWKNALGSRKNVVFKSYPNLTHAFMESLGGKPSPQDYDKTNHVSETVIGDIAAWILKTARK